MRHFLWAAAALALAAGTGCSISQNEENGDQEPKLGDYFVTLEPAMQTVQITSETPGVLNFGVNLNVECLAPLSFSECSAFSPFWSHSSPHGDLISARINAGNLPRTVANVSFFADRYRNSLNSLTGNEEVKSIRFFPSKVPPDLALAPKGGGRFDLKLVRPSPVGDREDRPTAAPGMNIEKSSLFITIFGVLAPNATGETLLLYAGPPTTITEVSVTGSDPANFTVLSPAIGHQFTGQHGGNVAVRVRFQEEFTDRRKALLKIETANLAGPIYVDLGGYREL